MTSRLTDVTPTTTVAPKAANNSTLPVFISIQTSAFSGATLLAMLLGAHPNIATIGEMNGIIAREDPQTYVCSCGQRILDCGFWRCVSAIMHRKGFEFDVAHFDLAFNLQGPRLVQYLRKASFRNKTLELIRDVSLQIWSGDKSQLRAQVIRNEAFVEAVMDVTGKHVFVDTSKDRLRLSALSTFSRFDIRAIHLVRDVRGVVASRIKRDPNITARQAAREWLRLHRRLHTTVNVLPDNKHIFLRYEDLCQDVYGTLERLYSFCGVDPSVMSRIDFEAAAHHIIGNSMRLTLLSQIRLDERWRRQLTPKQLKDIQRIAGRMNRRFGYS